MALVAIVLALELFPHRADACSCLPSGPPCQAFFRDDVVFIGTVVSISSIERAGDNPFASRRVRLSVEKAVRGIQGASVEIATGSGGGDCGYDFKPDRRYVVYGFRHPDGTITTGICSRTRAIEDASEDLQFFTALPALHSSGARVFGTVTHLDFDGSKTQREPIAGVQLLLRGANGAFSAITGETGAYEIPSVPLGAYEIEAVPQAPYSDGHQQQKVELNDARGCFSADFFLRYDGRITGAIADVTGRPGAGAMVQLFPASERGRPLPAYGGQRVHADDNGRYELTDVQPGDYVLGVNLTRETDPAVVYPSTFHPGTSAGRDATVIAIGRGTHVDLEPLRVPAALERYELEGVVVGLDGQPVAKATVFMHDRPRGTQVAVGIQTDAEGRFTFRVFGGLPYFLSAMYTVGTGTASRRFEAGAAVNTSAGAPPPVRLVLAPAR
jgi:hypothetical protein